MYRRTHKIQGVNDMARKSWKALFSLIVALISLTACGGNVSTQTTNTQKTRAVVKIATAGTLPVGTLIGGIDITLTLAPGVTAKSTANPPEIDAGVVVASGVASTSSQVLSTYTPPTGSAQGKAHLLVVNANGFRAGEFATFTGNIATGNNPTAAAFSVTSLTATDLNGSPIGNLRGTLTVINQ
jgi:hypothetical protein